MFNGVPAEQFHQFIASRTALPLPLPLPLPVTLPFHVPPNSSFSIHHELQQPSNYQLFQSHNLLQPSTTHEASAINEDEEKGEERVVGRSSLELEGVGSVAEQMDPWSKEEVLALLTIRNSMGNEFSDFIWGPVSSKLAELGFKRNAEKCKEKFEEVGKFCNTTSYGNYCSLFNELDALFEDPNQKSLNENTVRTNINEEAKTGLNLEESSGNETLENPVVEDHQQVVRKPRRKKRKNKHHKLELLKDLSEFVSKVMIQQEQLYKRLLEDMERREEERVAREEIWRKKEMERLDMEIEIRAKEQAIAGDREVTIIEFLKKFTSSSSSQSQALVFRSEDLIKSTPPAEIENSSASLPTVLAQSPISFTTQSNPNPTKNPNFGGNQRNPQISNSSTPDLASQSNGTINNTASSSQLQAPQNPYCISNDREDHGKRWPRDEVNSLINLRCNLYSSSSSEDKGSTTNKAPLWERISQGMLELGYRRSAKKCKEKWENINKYFRKTKDANKKRSVDSKTCPYFHQLSSLYNQGRPSLPSEPDQNSSNSPENFLETAETQVRPCSVAFDEPMAHVDEEGENNNMAQVSPLEFEY